MPRSVPGLLLSVALSLLPLPVLSDTLEVIELRHRNAEDIIPLIKPLLQGQGVVTGRGNQLIIRADPEQLRQLQALIPALDVPVKQLLISVRQQQQGQDTRRAAALSGTVDLGHEGSLSIGGGVPGSGVRIGLADGQTQRDARQTQQIRVLDGGEAYIQVGEDIPLQERYVIRDGRRIREYGHTEFQSLGTGFYVQPHLQADQVTLEISPQQRQMTGDGRIATQSLTTTVSGRLGEWLPVVYSDIRNSAQDSGLLRHGHETTRAESQIFLKVDVAP
ncbi:MAG: hypothetical protein H6970_02575 [Gammaproteobacteria bacterium]|nr:hypothetical protein [Gammaproteobacteria bacterium]MCP5459422.1 hypothetical protein [Gammaproteobacteria bacterium]